MFNIGDTVIHKKYGEGVIIIDKEQTCKKEEVLVKFNKKLPIPKIQINNNKYAGFTDYENIDIINIKDLESLKQKINLPELI